MADKWNSEGDEPITGGTSDENIRGVAGDDDEFDDADELDEDEDEAEDEEGSSTF